MERGCAGRVRIFVQTGRTSVDGDAVTELNGKAGQRSLPIADEHGPLLTDVDVTCRSVFVPRGWVHQKGANDDKQPFLISTAPDYGSYVIFAKEDIHPNIDLD